MITKVRNIGIIAHIDAGKTTMTERVLYYTGRIHRCGDVDSGNTTTDFDPLEREKGITISSAAVSCEWDGHEVNLIDTPGHVDFTAEVERSLRVLDGAVGLFCGVAGVEAQSETVWRQANKYNVPRIAFVNKLDRLGAGFFRVVESIRRQLRANAVPVIVPIGHEGGFRGFVDLVRLEAYVFEEAVTAERKFEKRPIPEEVRAQVEQHRQHLLEAASMFSDDLLHLLLDEKEVPPEVLDAAIRRGVVEGKFLPVFGGSAFKYIGVQHLLDAVVRYLPSPLDVPPAVGRHPISREEISCPPDPKKPLAAVAFKTLSTPNGEVQYIRVYSGTLRGGEAIHNARTRRKERIGTLYQVQAQKFQRIDEAGPGEIVAAMGLKEVNTGDTLCDVEHPVLMQSIDFAEPVVSVSAEAKRSVDRDKLTKALRAFSREDPTFRYGVNQETGDLLLWGMGELHIEVISHKIERDYKVPINLGRPKVAYKQTLKAPVEYEERWIKQTGGHGQYAVISMRYEPADLGGAVEFVSGIKGSCIRREFVAPVEEGFREAARNGGRLGFPFVNIRAILLDGKDHPVDSSDMAFSHASFEAFNRALEIGETVILEPLARFEVVMPVEFLGESIGSLNARRSRIEAVEGDDHLRTVKGVIPVAETFGYTTVIRSLTQGRGSASIEPSGFEPAPASVEEEIMEKARLAAKA